MYVFLKSLDEFSFTVAVVPQETVVPLTVPTFAKNFQSIEFPAHLSQTTMNLVSDILATHGFATTSPSSNSYSLPNVI